MNFTDNRLEREMRQRPRKGCPTPSQGPRGSVLRVSLLARHPLYDLFPGAAAPSDWEQGVTRWAIGS